MKPYFAFILLAALPAVLAQAAPPDPFLVVPGRSLGRVHLGLRGGADIKRLPHPDGNGTSKHGIYFAVWKSRNGPDTLAVNGFNLDYAQPPRPGLKIDEIRATSPQFHTSGGLAPGATLAEIKRHYPKGSLGPASQGPDVYYDVTGKGLGFEFPAHPVANTKSLAIGVVEATDKATLSAQDVQSYLEK